MATETIRARITKVEQRGEWYDVYTDGKPSKVGTKKRPLAVEAEQARRKGDEVELEITSRPGTNINPHTNLPYMNHWLESVREAPQQAAIDIPSAEAPTGRKTDPNDAWRMCLNKGGELAVMSMEYMERHEQTFENQKQIAIGWAYFFMTEPFPNLNSGENGGSAFQEPESVRQSRHGAYSEPDFAPVGGDDDIPF